MEKRISNQLWYDALVEECKAIITETLYRSRQELIEGKHALGERICNDPHFKKLQGNKSAVLQQIFKDIGVGNSEGYRCVQFYEKFPDLSRGSEKFVEQKNISWEKIKKNYLPEDKEKPQKQCFHKDTYTIVVCRDCGHKTSCN